MGHGWYSQFQTGLLENVVDPKSPSGHQHVMVPVAAGALRYDLTNVLTDISKPIEIIHWTKSSGHKNHLNIKSQFIIQHDGTTSYVTCSCGCIVPNDGWRASSMRPRQICFIS